jgi:hypothetical protein
MSNGSPEDETWGAELPARSWYVTDTLVVGEAPPDAISVQSAADAVEAILSGTSAALPAHRWDLAGDVLTALGISKLDQVKLLMSVKHDVDFPVQRLTADELEAAWRGVTARPGSGVLCVECGYFESASRHEGSLRRSRLPKDCPVCHGNGLGLFEN